MCVAHCPNDSWHYLPEVAMETANGGSDKSGRKDMICISGVDPVLSEKVDLS